MAAGVSRDARVAGSAIDCQSASALEYVARITLVPDQEHRRIRLKTGAGHVEISCNFAPAVATPDHIVLAERLGYSRAFVFDSPALYANPAATIALAAARTSRIALGIAVITPHVRHLVANASMIAHLATLAPGRFEIGVGTGFTSAALLVLLSGFVTRFA